VDAGEVEMRAVPVVVSCLLALASAGCRRSGPRAPEGVFESGEGLPARVFAGGGDVTFIVESSSRVRLHGGFETNRPIDDPRHLFIERWQEFPAGRHEVTVSIPAGTSGGLDANLVAPRPGDAVKLIVRAGDRELSNDSGPLEGELQPGTAWFAQVEVEDWLTLEPLVD